MTIDAKFYTVEEYLDFAQLPENEGKRFELIDGVIVEMPPSSKRKTIISARFGYHVSAFVDEYDLYHNGHQRFR